jgi:hypothetical protein
VIVERRDPAGRQRQAKPPSKGISDLNKVIEIFETKIDAVGVSHGGQSAAFSRFVETKPGAAAVL